GWQPGVSRGRARGAGGCTGSAGGHSGWAELRQDAGAGRRGAVASRVTLAKARVQPRDERPIKVLPVRVFPLNQRKLPRSAPMLELFLSCDGVLHGRQEFGLHQLVHRIALCETAKMAGAVLPTRCTMSLVTPI